MKQTVEEAAREARMASAETLTTYGTHTSLDDFTYLSHDEIAEAAFIKGADWRINSVWHDASERPDTDKGDLLVIVKDAFGKDVYVRQNAYYVLKYGCVRWAYIKDLIPNNEHFKV